MQLCGCLLGDEEVVPDVAGSLVEIQGVDFFVYRNGAQVELRVTRTRANEKGAARPIAT